MQSFADGEYRFILVYQDHGIKFCILMALKSKSKAAVAAALLRIFAILGPPKILQSDNGREFLGQAGSGKSKADSPGEMVEVTEVELAEVITEVSQLWPETKMVHGRARHSQSQGGVERLNRTVQSRLGAWMKDTGSKKWARVGLNIVQWTINTSFSKSINNTPHFLLTGQARRRVPNLPRDVVDEVGPASRLL